LRRIYLDDPGIEFADGRENASCPEMALDLDRLPEKDVEEQYVLEVLVGSAREDAAGGVHGGRQERAQERYRTGFAIAFGIT
jgi:hypothetical protein